ncbi:polyketide cyclase [Novosphingobium endophyticum]|uniref:Polyketide cyclase n=1 Tax=Novosphingobium endophyticum TaxID=1955250 RepID=A0A916TSN4_9SPHN|nr:nuclear transport factor 2 family protein [Novosphingobium endophyticum]GGC03547.1 polyketide cyclase [Novosphingobium endophyticum]
MSADLAERIDRLESLAAIQQLPMRYALAVDGRDMDAWVKLFVPDVHCGRRGTGRDVLRSIIEPAVRTFYRSIHQICGHRVEFDDADHAHGVVYCRAEHEDDGKWVIMAIAYFDTYERRGGEWLFVRRQEKHWYAADWQERPAAPFTGWAAHETPPRLPQDFESWNAFWAGEDKDSIARMTRQPTGE